MVSIGHEMYQRANLVWVMHHGNTPPLVDHKNRNSLDDRIGNLRAGSRKLNSANSKKPSTNTSGIKGVSWNKLTGKWVANIKAEGRQIYLGLYTSKHEAGKAYKRAAKMHFGKFACFK